MKRRDFLVSVLATFGTPTLALGTPTLGPTNWGWLPGYQSTETPFNKAARHLDTFGQDKVACLWKPYQKITGSPWVAHKQLGPDCVAHASGAAIDLLTVIQIAHKQAKERWVAKSSTDVIYAGGRKIIGQNKLGRRGGMHGGWAVKYLKTYGNLVRQQYGDHDLRPYSSSTLRYWDYNGVPEELLEIAKGHPLLEYAPVKSWEEFRDAIAAGYPVLFCAAFGPVTSRRDKDGFIRMSTSGRFRWYHAWCGAGVQDQDRPGALLINSHGSWGTGPKTHGQPDGSAWVEAKYIDKQCKAFGDSYALSLYKGFPKPEEDYILW